MVGVAADDKIDALVKKMEKILAKTDAKVQRGPVELASGHIEPDAIIIRIGDRESSLSFQREIQFKTTENGSTLIMPWSAGKKGEDAYLSIGDVQKYISEHGESSFLKEISEQTAVFERAVKKANDKRAGAFKDDNKPKNLLELVTLTFGNKLEDVLFVTGVNFDDKCLDLKNEVGTRFRDGNYSLKGHEDILKGAEILGNQLLDQAQKSGIKITDLKEFRNADFDEDGTVNAKEVGVLLLAADMGASVNRFGGLESEFRNNLRRSNMKSLIPPKANEALREIAKQLLQDNGVTVADGKTDAQFIQTMKANPAVPKERQ